MKLYRSPYEAYPFLSDADGDLRCDYEILKDLRDFSDFKKKNFPS